MPSATHQDLVLLFRSHPELVVELARAAGAALAPVDELRERGSQVDSPLAPHLALQADLIIEGRRRGRVLWAIVLEVQLGPDPAKRWSVDLYRASVAYLLRRTVWVLMYSPDPKVRRWTATRMFRDRPRLAPLVVQPAMIPVPSRIDPVAADPGRIVLAAVTHADPATVELALRLLWTLAPRHGERYIRLVMASVREEVLRGLLDKLDYDESQENYDEPLSEFERRGSSFVRGRREGLDLGRLEALRQTLLAVADARGLALSREDRARVDALKHAPTLRAWIARAATTPEGTKLELIAPEA